ncbi:hypothetical protein PT974_06799 [Cladobotryum mycophilum]|uniref:Uncharacterized protein n=1 Tax=Cladobotryum mycophilum TaxID=491253 RepID=A0ABR0SMH7_9HYPO
MSMIASVRKTLGRKVLQFEVTFAVYMLTPYEKFAFYSIVFLLMSLTLIAATLYLPHHVSILAGRVWYYINGDSIDVAASTRDAVKDMAEGVFGVLPTAAGGVVAKEASEALVREL